MIQFFPILKNSKNDRLQIKLRQCVHHEQTNDKNNNKKEKTTQTLAKTDKHNHPHSVSEVSIVKSQSQLEITVTTSKLASKWPAEWQQSITVYGLISAVFFL